MSRLPLLRLRSLAGLLFAVTVFASAACVDEGNAGKGKRILLQGKLFDSEDSSPIGDAKVEITLSSRESQLVLAESRTNTRGEIDMESPVASELHAETRASGHAASRQRAPSRGGYLELAAAPTDDTTVSGRSQRVSLGSESELELPEGALTRGDGKKLVDPVIETSLVDTRRTTQRRSVPGLESAIDDEGNEGQLVAQTALYVNGRDNNDLDQVVSSKRKLSASIAIDEPTAGPLPKTRSAYHFDTKSGRWVKKGLATHKKARGTVWSFAIDELGWWAVGELVEDQSCLRACLEVPSDVDADYAQVLAEAIGIPVSSSGFTDDEGCFAIDVIAHAPYSITVAALGAVGTASVIDSGDAGAKAQTNPKQCVDLGEIKLRERTKSEQSCPTGQAKCGASCVDIISNTNHCGRCDNECKEGVACVGATCEEAVEAPPDPTDDGGTVAPMDDGGITKPPAGCATDSDCPRNETCALGACDCADGFERCNGSCEDITTNASSCGSCGTPCASGESCTGGVCAAEDCFNATDDDSNGMVDCADPACSAAGAHCVPDGTTVGVLVPFGQACPAGFTAQSSDLHQGVVAPNCGGCSCGGASATSCNIDVRVFYDQTECQGDTNATIVNFTYPKICAGNPNPDINGSAVGWRTGNWNVTSGTCPPVGSPSAGAQTWNTSSTYCVADQKGAGCSTGFACVSLAAIATAACGETSASCSVGTQATWYAGATDTRSCGPCACTPSGASCNPLSIEVGHDWACPPGDGTIDENTSSCNPSQWTYSAPVQINGTPTNATCSASTATSGSVTPTGARTLCCQ